MADKQNKLFNSTVIPMSAGIVTESGDNPKVNPTGTPNDLQSMMAVISKAGFDIRKKADDRFEGILNQTVGHFSEMAPYNTTIANTLEAELRIAEEKTSTDVLMAASAISVGAKDAGTLLARADKSTMINSIKQPQYVINKHIVNNPTQYDKAQVIAASQAIATSFREYKLNEKMQSVAGMILSASQSYASGALNGGDKLLGLLSKLNTGNTVGGGSYANNYEASNAKDFLELYNESKDNGSREMLEQNIGKEKLDAMIKNAMYILSGTKIRVN